MRLLAMPSRELFGDNAHLSEIIERYRDRELARILDAGGHLGKTAEGFVQTRRAVDERFPDRVAAVELRGGLIAREVEPGDARLFEDVPASSLLRSLIEAQRSRGFDRGDDADAFAATAVGKARIAEALQDEPDSAVAEAGWTYLLSYPPRKSDDTSVAKDVVRRVSELSVSASLELMKGVADRFAYWLDAADEVFPDFEGARALWLRLLPYADEMSNTKASDSASDTVSDLSAAALNEPLGRLMSMYLRKCPEGAPNNPPKLPQPMTEMLRKLRGRSRQIVANRVALSMRYFAMADPEWLEDLVLQPMMSDDLDGKRIWEAVARYGDMPPPSLWSKLASSAYLKLAKGEFSPEARRRIAEMAILAWGWARLELVRFEVDGKALRSALSLAGDDVRTQAAWTFLRLLKEPVPESKFANDVWKAVGPAFFGEIWPLEPSLQGSGSSNHLAEVPFKVNANDFGAAANEVLPFLRPFEMWNVRSELGLDGEHARHLIATSPRIVVQILSAIIPEAPKHRVYGLNALLDELAQTEPALRRDRRMKALRRTAALEFS